MKTTSFLFICIIVFIIGNACNNSSDDDSSYLADSTMSSDTTTTVAPAMPDTTDFTTTVDTTKKESVVEEILKEVTKETLKEAYEKINEEYESGKEAEDVSQSKSDYDFFTQKIKEQKDIVLTREFKQKVKDLGIEINVESILEDKNAGALPTEQDSIHIGGSLSAVLITNSTNYTLNVSYSGVSFRSVSIAAHSSETIQLDPGLYDIAASVMAPNVHNYGGVSYMSRGYKYEDEYYIINE